MHVWYIAALVMDGLFGTLLVAHIVLQWIYKGPYYYANMLVGCALEIVGYTAIIIAEDTVDIILLYTAMTAAGANFAAAIYYTFSDTMRVCGTGYSAFDLDVYNRLFGVFSAIAFLLQLIPGLVTVHLEFGLAYNIRLYIVLGGVAIQTLTMVGFLILVVSFFLRVSRARAIDNYVSVKETSRDYLKYQKIRWSRMFKAYVCAYIVATLLILMRCALAVVRLVRGFYGVALVSLETVSMAAAVLLLTIFNPGFALKRRKKDKEYTGPKANPINEVKHTPPLQPPTIEPVRRPISALLRNAPINKSFRVIHKDAGPPNRLPRPDSDDKEDSLNRHHTKHPRHSRHSRYPALSPRLLPLQMPPMPHTEGSPYKHHHRKGDLEEMNSPVKAGYSRRFSSF